MSYAFSRCPLWRWGVINACSFRRNGVILGTGSADGCLADVASGLTGSSVDWGYCHETRVCERDHICYLPFVGLAATTVGVAAPNAAYVPPAWMTQKSFAAL